MSLKACTFKPGYDMCCKKAIQMINAGENELIYINILHESIPHA